MNETKTAFTPGPWANQMALQGVVASREAIVAEIKGRTPAEREANANLIEAAPEMYEALEDLLGSAYQNDDDGMRICKHCYMSSDPDPSVQADHFLDCPVVPAEAALKKVRGD